MAEIKKYLSLERLEEYDALIKAKIDSDIESHTHSWNDLEDRPFGEDVVLTEIFSETATGGTNSDGDGIYAFEFSKDEISSVVGYNDTLDYYVELNGVLYKTKMRYYDNIGNVSFLKLGYEDTGEPFCVSMPDMGNVSDYLYVDSSIYTETMSFKIYTGETGTKTIDEVYIPSTIARTTYVDTQLTTKADASHTHDDRYYTETEVDTLIAGVNTSISNITSGSTVVKNAEHATTADSATNADEATHAASADTATSATSATKATQDASGNVITSTYETKTDATAKLTEAKSYTDTKTNGMATTTVVDNKISAHNTSITAHSDIRDLISALTTKVNNFLDVDDTTTDQLSEVLTLIENNKGTLESLTSNKINVSDIVDNLTTSSTTKVLSAKQGVAIKALIDALQEAVNGKAAASHTHTISEVTNLQTTLNAKASQSDLDALSDVVDGKTDSGHTHTIANITNLQTTLDGKAAKSHTHTVSEISDLTVTAAELNYMDGVTSNVQTQIDSKQATITGAATTITGSNLTANRALISNANGKVAVSDVTSTELSYLDGAKSNIQTQIDTVSGNLSTHIGNADIHFTAAERTKLAGIATGATKVTVDSALSSTSTNPVANNAVNSAISTVTSAISANTSSIDAHTGRITALETKVGDGFEEISSEEIQSLFAQ